MLKKEIRTDSDAGCCHPASSPMRILQADFPFDGALAPAGLHLPVTSCERPCWASGGFHEAVETEPKFIFTTTSCSRLTRWEAPKCLRPRHVRLSPFDRPHGLLHPEWHARFPLLETLLPRPSAVPSHTRWSGIGVGSGLISLPCDRCLGPSPVPVSNLCSKQPSFLSRFCRPESPKLLLSARSPPLSIRIDDSLSSSSLAGLNTFRASSLTSLVDTKNGHKSQRPKNFQLSASTRNQQGL